MAKPIFKSNHAGFERINGSLKDMIQGHMALDIERYIKISAGTPVDTGAMKASARHYRSDKGVRVEVNKEYAAYQERGKRLDGSHVVRNYTTGGTGAGWFQKSIEAITRNRLSYIQEARKALNL